GPAINIELVRFCGQRAAEISPTDTVPSPVFRLRFLLERAKDVALRCARRGRRRNAIDRPCFLKIISARYYAGGHGAARRAIPTIAKQKLPLRRIAEERRRF